jgi:hypothetical protein
MDNLFDNLNKLIEKQVKEPLDNEESQLRFLTYWWCQKYNRPFKDPLLKEYTLEELYIEYRTYYERTKTEEDSDEEEASKNEEIRYSEAEKWAEEEERKEKELLEQQSKDNPIGETDVKWMEEQLKIGKKQFGDDFGENLNFEG